MINQIGYLILNQDVYRRMHWAHYNLAPKPTDYVIVYERDDDGVSVVYPTSRFMAMLMHGGLMRNMRNIGTVDNRPVFDGSGELLPPMTEQQAIEFVAWKDVPVDVQRAHFSGNRARIVFCRKSQLPERLYRDAWRLRDAA